MTDAQLQNLLGLLFGLGLLISGMEHLSHVDAYR